MNQKLTQWSILVFCSCLVVSCNDQNHTVQFPLDKSEFAQPTKKPFVLPKGEKIKWSVTLNDTVALVRESRIDLNNLPFDSFKINNVKPVGKLRTSHFDIDEPAATVFDLNSLPAKKLDYKVVTLGTPRILKTSLPRMKDAASETILTLNEEAGFINAPPGKIVKDLYGIFWIATMNGLCRFDGTQFEVFSEKEGLSNYYIQSLCISKTGKIWVSTANGIDVIDIKEKTILQLGRASGSNNLYPGKFQEAADGKMWMIAATGIDIIDLQHSTVQEMGVENGLHDKTISFLLIDRQQRIWAAHPNQGIDLIDPSTKSIKLVDSSAGLNNIHINALLEDNDGNIWVATSTGLNKIDVKHKLVQAPEIFHTKAVYTRSLIQTSDGKIWMGSNSGVDIMDTLLLTTRHIGTKEGLLADFVYDLFEDGQGQIWISCGYGLNIINQNKGRIRRINEQHGLSGSISAGIVEDNYSNIWLGHNEGIDIIDKNEITVKHLSVKTGLTSERLTCLAEDLKGRICIGTFDGLQIIDPKKGKISSFNISNGLTTNTIYSLMADHAGNLWVGCSRGLDIIYDSVIKHISLQEDGKVKSVLAMMEDDQHRVWISTTQGIYLADLNTDSLYFLKKDQPLAGKAAQSLLADSKGRIWIGHFEGSIDVIDEREKTIRNMGEEQGVQGLMVVSLLEKNHKIYAGSFNGLTVFTEKSHSNTKEQNWQIAKFGHSQGFVHLNFNRHSQLFAHGKFWWGVADQLLVMEEPSEDTATTHNYITGLDIMEHNAVFTRLQVDTDQVFKKGIRWDSTSGPWNIPINLVLPYDQNHITFHFTGLQYVDMDKTRYRFILQGNDEVWNDITEKSFADYRNLLPGRYSFNMSSRGTNGRWSKPAEFRFTISPPWWKTWWAYLIYVLIAVLLIRFYTVYRSRKLKAQNILLEEKITERTDQLSKSLHELKATQLQLIQSEKMASLGELTAGIAHEIQNPLNFVNNFSEMNAELIEEIKAELIAGNTADALSLANTIGANEEKINQHGKRADAIVKGMLQHSGNNRGVSEPTDFNALADEYVKLAYHGLRAKDKTFNCTLKTEFDPAIGNIMIIRQDIGRVILNLINNAFYAVSDKKKLQVAGYEPTVMVTSRKTGDNVELTVKDNGNGIQEKIKHKIFQPFFTTKPTGQGTGLGLSLSYDIVKAHGGEIKLETKHGEGTEFSIVLPCK